MGTIEFSLNDFHGIDAQNKYLTQALITGNRKGFYTDPNLRISVLSDSLNSEKH